MNGQESLNNNNNKLLLINCQNDLIKLLTYCSYFMFRCYIEILTRKTINDVVVVVVEIHAQKIQDAVTSAIQRLQQVKMMLQGGRYSTWAISFSFSN